LSPPEADRCAPLVSFDSAESATTLTLTARPIESLGGGAFTAYRLRGMVMIYKSFASIAALILLSGVAHAGSAPKELYGKSITVT
jgi:hypothetical protein